MAKASLNTYLLRCFSPREGGGKKRFSMPNIFWHNFSLKNVGGTKKGNQNLEFPSFS